MKNVLAIVAVLMLTVAMGRAQTAAPASIGSGLIVSSSALDIYYKGSASAGNLTRTQFDFLGLGAKKTNHIFVEANQLFAPTPGLSLYTFGAGLQPDLTKVFAKTNINPANFSTEFNTSIGAGIPAKGGNTLGFLFGGLVNYKVSKSVTFKALEFDYGGTGAQKLWGISAGVNLTNIFGTK